MSRIDGPDETGEEKRGKSRPTTPFRSFGKEKEKGKRERVEPVRGVATRATGIRRTSPRTPKKRKGKRGEEGRSPGVSWS